jgi:hypothetical protein
MNAVSAARNPARRGAAVMVLRTACRVFVHVVPLVSCQPSRQSIRNHILGPKTHTCTRPRHTCRRSCLVTPRERARESALAPVPTVILNPVTHARTLTRGRTSTQACLLADDSARTSSSTEREPNAPEASGIWLLAAGERDDDGGKSDGKESGVFSPSPEAPSHTKLPRSWKSV